MPEKRALSALVAAVLPELPAGGGDTVFIIGAGGKSEFSAAMKQESRSNWKSNRLLRKPEECRQTVELGFCDEVFVGNAKMPVK